MFRYGFALLSVGGALLIKHFLSVGDETPLVFLSCAVMFSAWYGGFVSGLVATAAGVVSAEYFFFPPARSMGASTAAQTVSVITFAVEGAVIAWLTSSLPVTRQQLKATARKAAEAGAERSESLHREQNTRAELNAALASVQRMLTREQTIHTELEYAVDARDQAIQTLQQREKEFRLLAEERAELLHREQTARAQAEAVSRIKDEFLATLSHELRTPMQVIMGWIQMLRSDMLDPPAGRNALATVERYARAQAKLIEDLLDASLITSGKLQLMLEHVELGRFVEATLDGFRPAANAKRIQLVSIYDALPCIVLGDPDRLRQVLSNLVSNAIKFSRENSRVEIRVQQIQRQVELRISDEGIGISADFLPHLFERFRQAETGTVRTHAGLGLGLALVREVVELHGGTVDAQSGGPGCGSTFIVRLPAQSPQADSEEPSAEPIAPVELSDLAGLLNGVRVLIVDDDVDMVDLFSRILRKAGAEVLTAHSAAAALEAVEHGGVDVLVSDIAMPREDGYDLIRRVRELERSRGGSLPAVALTAYARGDDRKRALDAGFHLHLSKAIDVSQLVLSVARLVGRVETTK